METSGSPAGASTAELALGRPLTDPLLGASAGSLPFFFLDAFGLGVGAAGAGAELVEGGPSADGGAVLDIEPFSSRLADAGGGGSVFLLWLRFGFASADGAAEVGGTLEAATVKGADRSVCKGGGRFASFPFLDFDLDALGALAAAAGVAS
jgi:hypothetical protein